MESTPTPESQSIESEGMTVLGDKLDNPYSVENMKMALKSLKAENISDSDSLELVNFEVKTTHLYVRFLPKDSLQLEALEKDSLILFDYPLDYEVKQGGQYYQNPDIPDGEITWQYTTVKADYQFPTDIPYEIIEECFILDEEEEETNQLKSAQINAFALLENKAMEMTDNLTEEEKAEPKLKGWFRRWFPRSYHPYGRITVYDTEKRQPVGVAGLKVRAHRIVKISYGTTNRDGYYRIHKSFRYNCFYGLRFESSTGVKLWRWYTTLTYARKSLGYHDRRGYSKHIGLGSSEWRLATVMNAVYDYYNVVCKKYGIYTPYNNLRICVLKDSKDGCAPMLRHVSHPFGYNSHSALSNFMINTLNISIAGQIFSYVTKFMQPDIIIGAGSNSTADIYETTCHELAHASHFRKAGSAFWAKYISYIITYGDKDNPYGDGHGNNAALCAVGEMWGYHMGYQAVIDKYGINNSSTSASEAEWFKPLKRSSSNKSSDWMPKGLLWDLIDNTNTKDAIFSIKDNTSGFTNKQFFDALDSDVKSPQAFRDRLLKETKSNQKTGVNELFKTYYWN